MFNKRLNIARFEAMWTYFIPPMSVVYPGMPQWKNYWKSFHVCQSYRKNSPYVFIMRPS